MRKTLTTPAVVFFVVAAAILAACKAQDNAPGVASPEQAKTDAARAQTASQSDGARRVTIQEAKELLDKNEAVMVDVRPKDQFAQGHIKGARSIMFSEIGARSDELPKDKLIILYCA